MPSLRYAAAAGALLLLSGPAFAQSVGQASGSRQDSPVEIQAAFNFSVPVSSGDSDDAQKSRDKARRAIYEMAAHECDLLREILAKECRMVTVTSNISSTRLYGQQQPDGYSVSGTMSFQVTLK